MVTQLNETLISQAHHSPQVVLQHEASDNLRFSHEGRATEQKRVTDMPAPGTLIRRPSRHIKKAPIRDPFCVKQCCVNDIHASGSHSKLLKSLFTKIRRFRNNKWQLGFGLLDNKNIPFVHTQFELAIASGASKNSRCPVIVLEDSEGEFAKLRTRPLCKNCQASRAMVGTQARQKST